jgi:hypothetical protein
MKVYKQMKMYNDDELNQYCIKTKVMAKPSFFQLNLFFKIIYSFLYWEPICIL